MFCFGQGTENIREVLKDILKDLILSLLQFESQVNLSPTHWLMLLQHTVMVKQKHTHAFENSHASNHTLI